MTDVYRNGRFEPDPWRLLQDEDEEIPPGGHIVVPLARWAATAQSRRETNGPLGVRINAGEKLDAILPDLEAIALIEVAFPKYSDGRSYSTARLLSERHGFKGELRAVGDVLNDQIPLMRRCGIKSFVVTHEPTRRALQAGTIADIRHHLQPTGQPEARPDPKRPWLRLPFDA